MKSQTQAELEMLVEDIGDRLVGSQLQELIVNERVVALGFYREGLVWLVLDLSNNNPVGMIYDSHPPVKKASKTKPLGLFLNSHAKGRYLQSIHLLGEYGRVFVLDLGDERKIEIRLIPKQVNVLVTAQGKSLSWEKPLPLKPPPEILTPVEVRSFRTLKEEWENSLKKGGASSIDPRLQWEKQKAKDLEKKRKALVEIEKSMANQNDVLWRSLGVRLKELGSFGGLVAEEAALIDSQHSLSWNIENAFAKAKQIAQKKAGAQERYKVVEMEILSLEAQNYSPRAKKQTVDLMKQAEAKGRKLHLASGAIVYCGKSAGDNLSLLRKARAWDLWLHLKDYPGAHAIIHRQKDQVIGGAELYQAAEWVVKESFASMHLEVGARLDVVIVECRFVRPIKGDKLGRVTYHSEKNYSFTARH